MLEVIKVKYQDPKSKKLSVAPLTVEWNNAQMVRSHSIKAVVREILNISKSTGAVQVNLVGLPGQGKSTLAETIAHLVHKMSDAPFTVKKWTRQELLNMQDSVNKLEPANHVLIYDDVSWLQTGKTPKEQIEEVTKTMTEIRHIKGVDVQIISILNFHYSYAIPKALRNSQFWVYLSIGSSELDNVLKLVGAKNTIKVNEFRRAHSQAQNLHKFSYKYGKYTHHYQYKKPFVPALFWNGDTLRHIVFPSRQWIDLLCSNCTVGEIDAKADPEELSKMKDEALKKFGIGVIRQALRQKLLQMGVNCYSPRMTQCMRYFEQYLARKQFTPQELADSFGLAPTSTKLKKSLPEDIAAIPTRSNQVLEGSP